MGRSIGLIMNAYGNLSIKEEYGLYWWSIEDWKDTEWEQIPKSLYDELNKFEDSKEIIIDKNTKGTVKIKIG